MNSKRVSKFALHCHTNKSPCADLSHEVNKALVALCCNLITLNLVLSEDLWCGKFGGNK